MEILKRLLIIVSIQLNIAFVLDRIMTLCSILRPLSFGYALIYALVIVWIPMVLAKWLLRQNQSVGSLKDGIQEK